MWNLHHAAFWPSANGGSIYSLPILILDQLGRRKLATVFRGCMMCGKIHWSLSFILVHPCWRFSSPMTVALGESRISPWHGTRDFQKINGHPVAIFTASLGMSLNPCFYALWSCSGLPTKTPAWCGWGRRLPQGKGIQIAWDELILSMWEMNVATSLVWI